MRDSGYEWLDPNEYPFAHHYLSTPHGKLHYVDEGTGDVLLMVHGNPSWSFEFRRLIKHFRTRFRCVACDHLGFGLSDKPPAFSYLPQAHAANLKLLVEHLGLKDITLFIQDWGGPIGMSYALDHPKNIRKIVTFNTWFWSLKGIKDVEKFSGLLGGPIGRFACKNFNAFPRFILPFSFGDKTRLSKAIHRQYTSPFPTRSSRKGTWVFPGSIIGQSEWLGALWDKRAGLQNTPVLLLWGEKDDAFGADFLKRWEETFANHATVRFPTVGHFVAEETAEEAIGPIEKFLHEPTRQDRR